MRKQTNAANKTPQVRPPVRPLPSDRSTVVWRAFRRVGLGVFTAAALSVFISTDLPWQGQRLQVGDQADRDIHAPRDVTLTDREATQKAREEAAAKVPPVYDVDPEVSARATESARAAFAKLQTLLSPRSSSPQGVAQALGPELSARLPVETWQQIGKAKADDLSKAQSAAEQITADLYAKGIRSNTEDLDLVPARVNRRAAALPLPEALRRLVEAVVLSSAARPNYRFNIPETERERRLARASVKPFQRHVPQGSLLLSKGQRVTAADLEVLKAVGLQPGALDPGVLFGRFVLTAFAVLTIGLFLRRQSPKLFNSEKPMLLLTLIVVSLTFVARLTVTLLGYEYLGLSCVVLAGMLTAILLDVSLAILVTVMGSYLLGVMYNGDVALSYAAALAGLIGIHGVSQIATRLQLIRTGVLVGLVNTALAVVIGLMKHSMPTTIVDNSLWGLGSGPICAVVTAGLVMFLERPFAITTDLRLLELSNPNEPLLRRLQMEAPGTSSHSTLVGTLAETAAEAIGADSLLTRVGCLYHDIGKVKRPRCFVENQFGEDNVHDRLTPSLSTLAIIAHVKDGVELARRAKIPETIVDFIQEHHGTTLVRYFYERAKDGLSDRRLVEGDFRYVGPKPRTRETAIVMLADSSEAAARTLRDPTSQRIETMVQRIIRERLEDGQLNDSDLTLTDLETIKSTFVRVLQGVLHARVEYPGEQNGVPRLYRKRGDAADESRGKDQRLPGEQEGQATGGVRGLRRA